MFTYFKLADFDSPDLPGSGKIMNLDFLCKLDKARKIASIPFNIISGVRTMKYNKITGGNAYSSHITGYEVDIEYQSIKEAILIIEAAIKVGFKEIGIDFQKIHLDNNPLLKSQKLKFYPNTPGILLHNYFPKGNQIFLINQIL